MRELLVTTKLGILLSTAFFILCSSLSHAAPDADFVFINGKIYTMDEDKAWATALVVSANKISHVGSNDGARKYIGSDTRVIDLKGKMLMPGFVDAHNHLATGGLVKIGQDLTGSKSTKEILERLRQYVRENPDRPFYFAHSWETPMFGGVFPTKQDLDSIVANRPLIMLNEDTHNAIANSKALQMADVNRSTEDPIPGQSYFLRNNEGEPTGVMFDYAAWTPVGEAIGLMDEKALVEPAELFISYLSRHGVTAYYDMGMMFPSPDQNTFMGLEVLAKREQQGQLPMRVKSAIQNLDSNTRDLDLYLQRTKDYQKKYQTKRLQIDGFKVWMDGVSVAETAVMLEPYESGKMPGTVWTEETTIRWLEAFHTAGFNFHFHCEGDGALRTALNAIEAVQKKHGRLGRRHVIHHASVIHPDDMPRFKALGVIVNTTPIYYTNWKNPKYEKEVLNPVLGEQRARERFFAHKRVLDNGGLITFGADVPGTNLYEQSPLYMIQAAVTLKAPLLPNDPGIAPLDRVFTLEQALRAYTINGAYQMGMENDIGSLEVGKLADLIVIEKNLFEITPKNLHQTRVLLTMSNGQVVHDAEFGIGDVEKSRAALKADFDSIKTVQSWLQ